jgi:hypothetical protein
VGLPTRLLILLIIGFGTVLPSSTARGQAEDADIPGIELPSGVIRSSVGGAVYDRVWRIDLSEGRVALIRLFGSTGAELGLYIYDSNARSLSTALPLRQSAKPGGIQRISAVLPAGVYYINVNGRNTNRQFEFTLSVSLVEDPTPPVVMVDISDGAMRVATLEPLVKITAIDSLSGVNGIRVRINDGAWSEWMEPQTELAVNLPPVEGRHQVEVQARNGADLVSDPVFDEVILDLTAPIATLLRPIEGATVVKDRPTVKYRFNEALNAAAWTRAGLVLFSLDGGIVTGRGSYDPARRIGTFTFGPLLPGVEYVVQSDDAKDLAGNRVNLEPWTLTYLVPTAINVTDRNARATGATPVSLTLRAKGIPAGAALIIERLEPTESDGWRWSMVGATIARGDDKPQRVEITADRSARYAIRYPGSATHATSRTASINVTLTPTITRLGGSAIRTVALGASAVAEFRVDPTGIARATLIRSSCTSTFSRCTVVERRAIDIDASGSVSVTWIPSRGNWSWQLQLADTSDHEAAISPSARFRVR